MRLIKLIIISAVTFFLLLTGFSVFIPGHIRISRAMNIPPGGDSIFNYMEDLSTWKSWHPALSALSDSDIRLLTESELQVRGQTISTVKKNENEFITEWKKDDGRPVLSGMKLINHAPGDSLTIQWYMDFRLRWYPWEKFKSLFYENVYGSQMEEGLSNLKNYIR